MARTRGLLIRFLQLEIGKCQNSDAYVWASIRTKNPRNKPLSLVESKETKTKRIKKVKNIHQTAVGSKKSSRKKLLQFKKKKKN